MKNRGKNNLSYAEGFKIEAEKFKEYRPLLLDTLQAQDIELITRGMLDKITGVDATALIDDLVYGISLRFRSKDYNSFTLNRHYEDPCSEVHKWIKPHNSNLKPAWYIQINDVDNTTLRLIRVNIQAFGIYLEYLIKHNKLEEYYNPQLLAYEFPLENLKPNYKGIFNGLITQPLTQ